MYNLFHYFLPLYTILYVPIIWLKIQFFFSTGILVCLPFSYHMQLPNWHILLLARDGEDTKEDTDKSMKNVFCVLWCVKKGI